ncbi:hypothetical protein FRC03_007323 [Tulasnella sp. 419]|nr:hypothetical protein FRC03_007323 [Tulasnella sp. 419]
MLPNRKGVRNGLISTLFPSSSFTRLGNEIGRVISERELGEEGNPLASSNLIDSKFGHLERRQRISSAAGRQSRVNQYPLSASSSTCNCSVLGRSEMEVGRNGVCVLKDRRHGSPPLNLRSLHLKLYSR